MDTQDGNSSAWKWGAWRHSWPTKSTHCLRTNCARSLRGQGNSGGPKRKNFLHPEALFLTGPCTKEWVRRSANLSIPQEEKLSAPRSAFFDWSLHKKIGAEVCRACRCGTQPCWRCLLASAQKSSHLGTRKFGTSRPDDNAADRMRNAEKLNVPRSDENT